MTKFKSNLIAIITLILVGTNIACVNSSPFFGNELVPPSQGMYTDIDSSIILQTFVITQDSMVGNVGDPYIDLPAILYAGNYNNANTGYTKSNFITNYSPQGFKDIFDGFGIDPVIDSMTISFEPNYLKGDTTNFSKLEIFKIDNFNMLSDSTYYTHLDIEKYIDPIPLVTTEIKSGGRIVKHLPIQFAREHLDTNRDTSSVYHEDVKFHKKHNGLYFKLTTEDNSGPQYSFDMAATQMFLYYHAKDKEGKQVDTTQNIFFANDDEMYILYNTAVQLYKHDYKTADQSIGGVNPSIINDTINPSEKVYVATQSSLGGKVVIEELMIQDFLANVHKEHGMNAKIALHRAELKWHIVDRTWQNMDTTLHRIALYADIDELGFIPEYIPTFDYNVMGGDFERSSGVFTMDITQTVQRIILGKNKRRKFELFPQLQDLMVEANTVVWGSEAKNPSLRPKIHMLYTVVR